MCRLCIVKTMIDGRDAIIISVDDADKIVRFIHEQIALRRNMTREDMKALQADDGYKVFTELQSIVTGRRVENESD
jgi:hypothetical protein